MDFMSKAHADYRELCQMGVRCGKLQCLNHNTDLWQLECLIMADISREDAKRAVEQYCRNQWEGIDFKYFTKHGAKTGQFWVTFTSFAL